MNRVDPYLSFKKGNHLRIDGQRLERCGEPSRHRHPSLMEHHVGPRKIEPVNPLVLDSGSQSFGSPGRDLVPESVVINQRGQKKKRSREKTQENDSPSQNPEEDLSIPVCRRVSLSLLHGLTSRRSAV